VYVFLSNFSKNGCLLNERSRIMPEETQPQPSKRLPYSMTQHLFTPWRMAYIRGEKKPTDGSCIFCDKQQPSTTDPDDLIVARSEYVYVIMNKYPYNNGHMMVVPYVHVSSPEELPAEALTDLTLTTNRCMDVLRKVYNAESFNIGANVGAPAGAGIAAHYHFHIVPRWYSDANFMTIVGDTRVVPDSLENTYRELVTAWRNFYDPAAPAYSASVDSSS
jgi:ATP adenylyltransferase